MDKPQKKVVKKELGLELATKIRAILNEQITLCSLGMACDRKIGMELLILDSGVAIEPNLPMRGMIVKGATIAEVKHAEEVLTSASQSFNNSFDIQYDQRNDKIVCIVKKGKAKLPTLV